MELKKLLQPQILVIGVILLILTIFSFIIRTLPAYAGTADVVSLVGMDDPLYHLRLVEQMLPNFPDYPWFDPMTYYPAGQPMHWGPLFSIISVIACILAGASTRPEIITVSLFVAPLMAALLVPVIYLLVAKISDWKAGLIAAFFISFMPGQIFFRSFYGYFDHHIAEVLFSTLFCLCYMYAMIYCYHNPAKPDKKETWKIPAILGVICGIVYVAGLAIMPTMLLFALLVGIVTPLWFIIQRYTGHTGTSVLIINTTTFIVAILGFFCIGIHAEGGLNYYTIGHPIAYFLLILGTVILYGLLWYLREKPFIYYPGAMVAIVIAGVIILAVALPDLFNYLMSNANAFFGQGVYWKTIQEARQWTVDEAWATFQFSFPLFFAGMVVLFYRLKKKLNPSYVFLLVWSIVILYAAWQHVRYEYYLAVPIAILGGITAGSAIDLFRNSKDKSEQIEETSKKGKKVSGNRSTPGYIKEASIVFLIFVVLCTVLFSWIAIDKDLSVGRLNLNSDWHEAMDWMEKSTPETGMDYYKIYPEENWTAPDESYGVMSWWDYGHIILYIGKRMPNANPFQYGVAGDDGAARFFITGNESEASGILDRLHTKYVVTDYEMDTGKFWAMATWNNSTIGVDPYQQVYAIPDEDNPQRASRYSLFTDDYFKTTVSKLHNFDGSMTEPDMVHYVKYVKPEVSGLGVPLIVDVAQVNSTQATRLMNSFNETAEPEYGQALANTHFTTPVTTVQALKNYRLVHESPTRATSPEMKDIRYVKIFEYVKGAEITGTGTIKIDIKTNTGREFTYMQESVNGTFIVPYSTDNNSEIITGKYQTSDGKTFTVTDEQVENGLKVN